MGISAINIINVNIGNDYEINLDNNSVNNQLYVTNNKDNSFIRENISIDINPSFMNNNNNSNNDTLLDDDDEDDHPFYMKDEIDFSLINEYNNFY